MFFKNAVYAGVHRNMQKLPPDDVCKISLFSASQERGAYTKICRNTSKYAEIASWWRHMHPLYSEDSGLQSFISIR